MLSSETNGAGISSRKCTVGVQKLDFTDCASPAEGRLRGIKTNGLDADLKVRTTRTALFQQLANAVLLQITFARGLSVATRAALCQALQSTLDLSSYFGGGAAECGFWLRAVPDTSEA